jgi:hypothetical protein
MALLHKATLTPTKLELISTWLAGRGWAEGAGDPRILGTYRFDDPADEVGLEGFVLTTDVGVLHAPLTYRGAPLEGSDEHLVGTCEHSVLGPRWVYDACADPAWVAEAARTILTGGTGVDSFIEVDGRMERREPSMTVLGSGDPETPVPPLGPLTLREDGPVTTVHAGSLELAVVRRIGEEPPTPLALTGRWADADTAVLAGLRTG